MSLLQIDAIQAVGVASATLVNIELTDGRGDPVVGYVDLTDLVMVLPTVVTTDENGQVTVDLVPNSEILPGNTCYTVRLADKQFLIQKSGATQNLFEALVVDPGNLDPLPGSDFLTKANNLSDVQSASESRDNLGLGDSAVRDVGQVAGTVAAGDDPRFAENADALQAHIDDTADAHDASAISVVPFATITSTDVQAALEEVYSEASGAAGAADVSFIPSGDIVATDVQAAIEEVDAELHTHETDPTDAHDASAISFVPTGNIAATDAQAAISEVDSDKVDKQIIIPTNGTHVLDVFVTGDTDARMYLNGNSIFWGSGAGPVDASIFRNSSNLVRTGGNFQVNFGLTAQQVYLGATSGGGPNLSSGTGSPEGVTSGFVGSTFHRTDGGSGTALYVKESGTGNTGWSDLPTAAGTTAHIADITDAHDASAISVVPFSTIAATNVQAALEEIVAEAGGSTASSISFTPTGNISATNVQDAIAEVETDAIAAYVPKLGNYAATTTNVVSSKLAADTQYRWTVDAGGTHRWGPGGVTATDVSIARAGTGTLTVTATNINLSGQVIATASSYFHSSASGAAWRAGSGSPEGSVIAPIGSIYSRTGGSGSTAFYYKGTGISSTGWVAIGQPLDDHIADTTDAHAGTAISFTPTGTISSTNVQNAIAEVATDADATFVPKLASYASAGTNVLSTDVIADSQRRFILTADGKQLWGSGALAGDTNLYRGAADQLKTDDSLFIANQAGIGVAPSASAALTIVSGTAAAQGILWGTDTNLYRSAADTLTTDDLFTSGNRIQAALSATAGGFRHGASGPIDVAGTGTPEAVVTAPIGSAFRRTDGAAGSSFYIKRTGAGNTGWAAVDTAAATTLTAVPGLSSTDVQDAVSRLPKGILGSDTTAPSNHVTAASAQYTEASITLTTDSTRLYRVYLSVACGVTAGTGSQWSFYLRENGVNLASNQRFFAIASGDLEGNIRQGWVLYAPTSGSKTLTVGLTLDLNTGSLTVYANTLTFTIEDVGPR